MARNKNTSDESLLNGICPYFTMFPLDFPLRVLRSGRVPANTLVVDPFCGRGTTLFAARTLGYATAGLDANPVATAITAGKLAEISPASIVREYDSIVRARHRVRRPSGEFWEWAFEPSVLKILCQLRQGLRANCRSQSRRALRALVLGLLHGPMGKTAQAYCSNQMPRTYAPKPAYALGYWKKNLLPPPAVDLRRLIRRKAKWFFDSRPDRVSSQVGCADSRKLAAHLEVMKGKKASIIITSPPYYGMRTYLQDQWLRHWFVGGSPRVDYRGKPQIRHQSPKQFASDLRKVWQNLRTVSTKRAQLVIRFGGINDRKGNPRDIIRTSLDGSGWAISTIKSAGTAANGKRQSDSFQDSGKAPLEEIDVWCHAA